MELFEVPKGILKNTEKIDLWKPMSAEHVTEAESNKGLFKQYNNALGLIARSLAPKYELDSHDFVIRLWLNPKDKGFISEIHRGIVLRIYFGILPTADNFDKHIKSALKQARRIRGSKAIERVDRLMETKNWFSSRFPMVEEVDKFSTFEIEVTVMRKVKILHKPTGLIVEREAIEGKVTYRQLIAQAKIELSENVELVQKLHERSNVKAGSEGSIRLSGE